MSKAKRCNCCKGFFDPEDVTNKGMCASFKNPVFQTAEDARANKVTGYLWGTNPDETIDLCPDCTPRFMAFMRGEGVDAPEYSGWIKDLRADFDGDDTPENQSCSLFDVRDPGWYANHIAKDIMDLLKGGDLDGDKA